jgi:hypothetical protein
VRRTSPLIRPTLPALALAFALLGGACGKGYLVGRVRFGQVQGRASERDVRRTSNYVTLAPNIRTVAFRAPDTCFTQTAGRATGLTQSSGAIMTTECAVWLAELERAVTREGYRVISWDVLMRAERTGSGSIYDVAKKLGADLVFILNSLEAATQRGGGDLMLSFAYHHSDPDGTIGAQYLLDDQQRRTLGEFMKHKLKLQQQQQAAHTLSVVLDTTAILAATGESVWYYRWGATRLLGLRDGGDFLFRGRGLFWRPVLPRGLEITRKVEDTGLMSSQEVMMSTVSARGEDAFQQALFGLVQSVAKDFVLNFRAGGQ